MSQDACPLLSVVVPTHQRADMLAKVLSALAVQTFPAHQFEVVVVMDGPDQATELMLRKSSYPFSLRWFTQPPKGAPAARSRGVASARADLLVFIDDDIVVTPRFLDAHYAHHRQESRVVVLGALKPSPDSPGGFVDVAVDWTEGYFERCSKPGYQAGGIDLVSNNFSAAKNDILRAGGWDETFEGYGGGDDRDLGLRLEALGMHFRFEVQALGYHNQTKVWSDVIRDVRQSGRNFPRYMEKHPDELKLICWAVSNSRRRLLFRAIGVCPELAFKALNVFARLTDRMVGNARRGRLLESLVRLSSNAVFVRGIWETPEAARRLSRQLSVQERGTVAPVSRAD
ncbi:MAG: glycosyltransferase family 2 protein [Terriglobia bacterium]